MGYHAVGSSGCPPDPKSAPVIGLLSGVGHYPSFHVHQQRLAATHSIKARIQCGHQRGDCLISIPMTEGMPIIRIVARGRRSIFKLRSHSPLSNELPACLK